MMYCNAFELSKCGKKMCCFECEQDNCQERCHCLDKFACPDRTKEKPIGYIDKIVK